MAKNYGINEIANWKFNRVDLPIEWAEHLGNLPENFRMMIHGKPKNGKTEYLMKLSKMLSEKYGKVNFNSTEQGKSPDFQDAFFRNKLDQIEPGKFMLAEPSQTKFDNWFKKLERPNSGRIIVLDSIDYMQLTVDQFKQLHERFKKKAIIVVCWDDPWWADSKKMRYMIQIMVEVNDFYAKIASRFGGNKTYDIWPERRQQKTNGNGQLTLEGLNGIIAKAELQ